VPLVLATRAGIHVAERADNVALGYLVRLPALVPVRNPRV